MATDPQTPAPEGAAPSEAETEDEKRRPYVVVLMSAEMKAALKAFAEKNQTNPTALGRVLFADHIGYDLSQEPEPAKRSKFSSDDERAAAKLRNSKKSGLLRRALFQLHQGQLKKRPDLLAAANSTILALSDDKITFAALVDLETILEAAIKAAK